MNLEEIREYVHNEINRSFTIIYIDKTAMGTGFLENYNINPYPIGSAIDWKKELEKDEKWGPILSQQIKKTFARSFIDKITEDKDDKEIVYIIKPVEVFTDDNLESFERSGFYGTMEIGFTKT